MSMTLTETTRRRLGIQGFEGVDDAALAQVAPWLRLAFGLCAVMAAVGTSGAPRPHRPRPRGRESLR